MILNDFTVPKTKFSNEQLDAVLAELCGIVIEGQQDNPDFNGMVAAAVIDPTGKLVTGLNYLYGNYRIHAERAAIDKYEEEYGELPRGSIVVTTLSPCSDKMTSRYEESCADLLNSKGVKVAYCGYNDPTQENIQDKFVTIVTENSKIKLLCKKFADTFLKDELNEYVNSNTEHREGLDLEVRSDDNNVSIYAYDRGGREIAHVHFDKNDKNLVPYDLEVGDDYRGQGIAAVMYDYAKELGYHITRSPDQTDAGKYFWDKNRGEEGQVWENFADGKKPGRKGLAKRSGVNCKQSVSKLRSIAAHSTGEKQRMAHWCANMKSGKKKTNEETSKQILSYIKKVHPKGEFRLDQAVTDQPEWTLTQVPLSSLHIDTDDVSPYGQINWIDYDHVATITAQDIKNKPIVVDNDGWIIDGNHRAVAARDMGMTKIPAYVPVESDDDDDQETYAQHMARVNKERELSEVIHHTGIKTKNQDTSGLVNKGEPVPAGKEKRLLGNLVGNIGQYEVYKWDKGNDSAYSVFDPKTRISQMTISGHNKPHSFEIFGIYGGPKAPIKAADLYAWLVKDQGLTLVSDKYQSPGGQRVWQDLEQRYGRSINVYAFNIKTNKPINTGADDPESTHGTRGDIAQNVRLVASPK